MSTMVTHHPSEARVAGRQRRLVDALRIYGHELLSGLRVRYRVANAVCGLIPTDASGAIRTRMYRWAGFRVDPSAFIMANLHVVGGQQEFYGNLTVGPLTLIAQGVTFNLDAEIQIGQNVSIGPGVIVYTGTHPIGPGSRRMVGQVLARPVTVEDGCWIGLGAMILPGITLGHGSIVAAGSVVTEDVAPDTYVAGNPARVIQSLPWGDR